MNDIGRIPLQDWIEVLAAHPHMDPESWAELQRLGLVTRRGKPRRVTTMRTRLAAALLLVPLMLLCSAAGFGAAIVWNGKNSTATLRYEDAWLILEREQPSQRMLGAAGNIVAEMERAIELIGVHVDDEPPIGTNLRVMLRNVAKRASFHADR